MGVAGDAGGGVFAEEAAGWAGLAGAVEEVAWGAE